MKSMITAVAGLCALAGVAAAEASPRWGGQAAIQPAAAVQSGSAACGISVNNLGVTAHAAPAGADSWSLEVRAPGFAAEQSGPLIGHSPRMAPLSHVLLSDGRPFLSHREGRGMSTGRDENRRANPARPLQADLLVRDAAGRVVCQDHITLTQ